MRTITAMIALIVAIAVIVAASVAYYYYAFDNPQVTDDEDNDQTTTPTPTPEPTNPTPTPGPLPMNPPPTTEDDNDTTPPTMMEGEPSLWMDYTVPSSDTIQYGMPTPWSNQFTIAVEMYGEDQPSGDHRIAHIIHISDAQPRSGVTGDPEGSVEIKTYDRYAEVFVPVSLFDDGQGGCYGVLVNNYTTGDHTWIFNKYIRTNFNQTFFINMTALGDHTVQVYAGHDQGDGTLGAVSNILTRTFHTDASRIIAVNDGHERYVNYYFEQPAHFDIEVALNNYYSINHGLLPYAYSQEVRIQFFVTGNHTLQLDGQNLTGTPTTLPSVNVGYPDLSGVLYDLGTWNAADPESAWYSCYITYHEPPTTLYHYFDSKVIVTDMGTGDLVGHGTVEFDIWQTPSPF